MFKNQIWIVLIVSLCGFQFGYNTAIISGALLFISKAFSLSTFQEGHAASILLIGALVGASLGGVMANRLGRKRGMQVSSLFFMAGALIASLPGLFDWFLLGRIIQGLGVGSVSVIAPMYLAEIAPAKKRGTYVSLNQFMLVVGILFAYSSNLFLAKIESWEKMIGLGFIPACVQFLFLFFIPDTHQKDREATRLSWRVLLQPVFCKTLLIGVLLSVFQQITGINAVIYFAPKIFEEVGFSAAETAIFATLGLGIINIIATALAVKLIDKVGRLPLLIWGTFGMVVSLAIVGLSLLIDTSWVEFMAVFGLMMYIASFAIGMGPVPWLLIAEIYPTPIRAQAMSVAVFCNWLANYLVTLTFLDLIQALTLSGAFFLYAAIGVVAIIFIRRAIRETKNDII